MYTPRLRRVLLTNRSARSRGGHAPGCGFRGFQDCRKYFDGIRTGKHDVGGGTRGVETRARARRTLRDPPDTSARARRAGGVFMCKRGEMSENFLDFYEETKK